MWRAWITVAMLCAPSVVWAAAPAQIEVDVEPKIVEIKEKMGFSVPAAVRP